MPKLNLSSDVCELWGVGDFAKKKFSKLEIYTVGDLLYTPPFRYDDTREILTVKQFVKRREGTFKAKLINIDSFKRGRYFIINAKAEDDTAEVGLVWFNQKYILRTLKVGQQYLFSGKLSNSRGREAVNTPKFELCKDGQNAQPEHERNLGAITPVYPATEGISSNWIRAKIKRVHDQIGSLVKDTLPDSIRKKYDLLPLDEAIYKLHFPKEQVDIDQARRRLAFDELIKILIQIEQRSEEYKSRRAVKIDPEKQTDQVDQFIKKLEFELSKDQKKAIEEMLADISDGSPMRRLLNGDVGSGKTVVSFILAYYLYLNGYTSIFMAPTTILAQQHWELFRHYSRIAEIDADKIILEKSGRKAVGAISAKKENMIIVGTHSLLYEKQLPKDTALVVIDEQHRFGVKQRERLGKLSAQKLFPHYLSMTATPIPRTLTNVLYGDMAVSYIKTPPKSRQVIQTHLVPSGKRDECFKWAHEKIVNDDAQLFVIYPIIEKSEKLHSKSLLSSFEEMKKSYFKDIEVGLLHGRLKDEQKDEVLRRFKEKEYQVLVSTTVVEVGIDIPDATIMIIEGAERFGLAQLHQLRGRVGRGDKQAYCFVIPSEDIEDAQGVKKRLEYFAENSNGFDLAQFDLKSRGPGEVYGNLQAGIPNLKIADIMDIGAVKKYREASRQILDKYNDEEIEDILGGLFY